MKEKKIWEKYLDRVNELDELESIYRKLRAAFKEEGWTDEDLEHPPYYPRVIMALYEKFHAAREKLHNQLNLYFGDFDVFELDNYIQKKLRIIDLETPLRNGNNKRDNRGNEDY
jgi:hypothetical protein